MQRRRRWREERGMGVVTKCVLLGCGREKKKKKKKKGAEGSGIVVLWTCCVRLLGF